MEIINKSWKVTAANLIDPYYYYEDVYVYGVSLNMAKSKGFDKMKELGAKVETKSFNSTKDIEYKDIKVYRSKENDLVNYNGEEIKYSVYKKKVWCDKRDSVAKKLVEDYPDGIALVYNGSYGSYWGPNKAGYYSDKERAGKYSTKEAYEIVRNSDYDRQEKVILLDKLEYNEELDKSINKLKERIKELENKKLK